MASLFEYNRQLDELFARATDEDGTIDESLTEELEALQMDRDEKLDNCIWFYKSRKAMAAALKDEKKAIERRQKTAEREAESMKAKPAKSVIAGISPSKSPTWTSCRTNSNAGKLNRIRRL